jgi:hypothetical protein
MEQKEKEITAHLMGGMGNLLFIVAASFALSKKYKTKLRFYCNSDLWRDSKRQNIKKYKMFETFDIDCVNNRKSGITYREPHFFYDSVTLDRRIHNCIYGYFQSYKYFNTYKSEFINMLHNPYKQAIEETLKKYSHSHSNNSTVSIHVRRTDYLALSDVHLNLDMSYYEEAMSHFSAENSTFVIFSDDVEFIRREPVFQKCNHKHIVTSEDDEYCFWLMAACEHNIIANSSFSWWASYINSNPNKIIISPNRWFGQKGPVYKIRDIIPETPNYKLIDIHANHNSQNNQNNPLMQDDFGMR